MEGILIPVAVLGTLALAFGAFLIFSAEKFKIKKDERVEEIEEILPGIDCGACGAPGCAAFAQGVVEGEYGVNGCKVGGEEVAKEIASIMDVEVSTSDEEEVAVLKCLGGEETAVRIAEYFDGIQTCDALHQLGGDKGCQYGCLGLGDCVEACPFDAIEMGGNGLPYVIEDKCTACGNCVEACPRDLFELIPKSQDIYIACSSYDGAKTVKQVCDRGCIGCSLCVKMTEDDYIEMDGKLAVIQWKNIEANEGLKPGMEKCPQNTFIKRSELKGASSEFKKVESNV